MTSQTTGLDPEERVRFRSLLSDLAGERIVILSTHIVSDAAATAARVAVMNRGRLLKHATPEMLLQTHVGQILAATPIRKNVYVLGKWLSNLILVAILLSVMAGIGIIMQLVRGEDLQINPLAMASHIGCISVLGKRGI